MTQKLEMIGSLQQRLSESEKRFDKFVEESSRNASVTSINEKLRSDLKKVIGDLEKAHLDIQDRVRRISNVASLAIQECSSWYLGSFICTFASLVSLLFSNQLYPNIYSKGSLIQIKTTFAVEPSCKTAQNLAELSNISPHSGSFSPPPFHLYNYFPS